MDDEFKTSVIAKQAVLETKVEQLLLADKAKQELIDTLIADSNRNKGALWVLVTIGGLAGAFISNLKSIASFLSSGA